MERSQSYTSFDTTGSGSSNNKSKHYNLSRTNFSSNNNNNSNSNGFYNNYKNKFASTSSLNLRKALEMRQTQLQMQQQQQKEQLQRQQWLLLYEQQRQQQQLLKQQQQQLQHAQSSDNLNTAPLFLSSLNGLQLLQKRRQKMLQRQKSTSIDELDFPLTTHTNPRTDDEDDDEDFDVHNDNESECVILREHLRSQTQTNNCDDDENQLTLTANNVNSQLSGPLQQKLIRFQRQRPFSEAAISYRATSPLATDNQLLSQSQSAASSPTATSSMAAVASTTAAATTKSSPSKTERRRLQQFDQSLSFDSATTTTTPSTANISGGDNMSPLSPRHPHFGKLKRDNSLHSDSSRYSSVDSLLESRKPDPEAILINLGFGPVVSEDILSRIPKRFLKPSQLRGIDTEAFVRRLQLANSLADHSVLGYRGLIGNPDLPPSTIVAKIMQRFEVNERKKSMGSIEQTLR